LLSFLTCKLTTHEENKNNARILCTRTYKLYASRSINLQIQQQLEDCANCITDFLLISTVPLVIETKANNIGKEAGAGGAEMKLTYTWHKRKKQEKRNGMQCI
jgi:hypothetical protein